MDGGNAADFLPQRPDVLSRDDLAIQRGLRMLYGRRSFSDREFQRIRRRYSPYGTVASLYLWAVAAGALPELRDPAPPRPESCGKAPIVSKRSEISCGTFDGKSILCRRAVTGSIHPNRART